MFLESSSHRHQAHEDVNLWPNACCCRLRVCVLNPFEASACPSHMNMCSLMAIDFGSSTPDANLNMLDSSDTTQKGMRHQDTIRPTQVRRALVASLYLPVHHPSLCCTLV